MIINHHNVLCGTMGMRYMACCYSCTYVRHCLHPCNAADKQIVGGIEAYIHPQLLPSKNFLSCLEVNHKLLSEDHKEQVRFCGTHAQKLFINSQDR